MHFTQGLSNREWTVTCLWTSPMAAAVAPVAGLGVAAEEVLGLVLGAGVVAGGTE